MPQSSGFDQSQSRAAPAEVAQIATSNRTLNAFLGGPRPAWMTGASSSSAPTVNQGSPSVNHSTPTVVRSNIRAKKNRPSTYLRRASNPIVQPIEKPDSVEVQTQRNGVSVLPSPAPTDEPSPVVSIQQESPGQTTGDHAQVGEDTSAPLLETHETSREVTTETATSDLDRARQAVEAMYRDQVTQPSVTNTVPAETQPSDGVLNQGLSQGRAQVVVTEGRAEVVTLSYTSNPPTNQLGIFQEQPNPRAEATRRAPETAGNSEPPSKRARTHASNQSAQQSPQGLVSPTVQWLEALNNRVAQHSQTLHQYCERPRYQCLHEALMKNDLFYVALHQVFCLGSTDRSQVHSLFSSTLDQRTVDVAFEILQSVLRPNDQISSEHLQWFSNFPSHLSDLIANLRPYSCALADVALFLKSMTESWAIGIQNVKARNFPLLTSELLGMFKCVSPSLQTMLFTVSRRNLMVQDGPHAAHLNTLFSRNQAFESHVAARRLSNEEVERGRQDFATQFANVVRAAQVQERRENPAFSPQMVPAAVAQHRRSSTHSQPSPNPALPQRLPPPVAQQVRSPAVHSLPARPQALSQQVTSPTYPPQAGYPNGQLPSPGAILHNQHLAQQGSPMLRQVQSLPGLRPPHNHTPQMNHLPQPHPVPSNGSFPGMPRRASGVQSRNQHGPVVQGGTPQALPSPRLPHPQNLTRRLSNAVPGHAALSMNPEHWATRAAPGPQIMSEASNPNYVTHRSPGVAPPRQNPQQAPLFGIGRIPPNNYPPSPYDQASIEIGLHHRGRSPRREPLESTNTRFYQFVKGCAVKPIEIEPRMGLRTLSFNVSAEDVARLARRKNTLTFPELPHSHFTEGSLRYRLRLCIRPSHDAELTESLWALSAAHWPDHIVIEFNGTPMELPRKQHFHKDLPLELTNLIRIGENRARISLPLLPLNQKQGFKYFIGVDVVETRSHASLLYEVHNKQHVMEEETKEELRRRLKPSDSDDMIIENQTLSVTLADPFSSSIFMIPVRGEDCKHLECFDLETWLNTRPSKPKQKKWGRLTGQEPSMVDVWKCPICDLDARPSSLRINDFFVQVRKNLTDRNMLNTKAILVEGDGKWSPVEEPDDSDDDTPAPSILPARAQKSSRAVSAPEVIEILDD